MIEKDKNKVIERLRAKIPNYTRVHVNMLANIIVTVNHLLDKHGIKKPHLIGEASLVIENWYYDKFEFNIGNILKLETILNEKIITVMIDNPNKQEKISELLSNIPNHTAIFIEMEMLILFRIIDLLDLCGWTKEKVNSETPEIIKSWFNEQFDFDLLSIAKMEYALNARIIKVIDYK